MKIRSSERVLGGLVSPYGLAAISYLFFLFACLIPPSTYSYFINEPDLMFLDPATILFFSACVSTFIAGVLFIDWLFPSDGFVETVFISKIHPALFLLVPLASCVGLSILSSVLLVKNNPMVMPLLIAQEAGRLGPDGDYSLELQGTLNLSYVFIPGIVWWSVWRFEQLGSGWRGKVSVRIIQLLSLLAVAVSSTLNSAKHALIVFISGLAITYLLRKTLLRLLRWSLVGKVTLAFGIGGVVFFFLISTVRSAAEGSSLTSLFFGYTIASYNRLAALLNGNLHFEYSQRGIYWSTFLSFNRSLNQIIPYREVFGIPDYLDWWRSEFASVARAGLDSGLIFFGTFGEVFVEIGWLSPLYLLGYGILYGLVWRLTLAGHLVGIILYPYFAYCILFWFATNGLFDLDVVGLTIDVFVLAIYESFLIARKNEPSTLVGKLQPRFNRKGLV